MSKLTSVEWLWQQIDDTIPFINLEVSQVFNGLLNAAKELHKEEIENAYIDGASDYADEKYKGMSKYYYDKFKRNKIS